MVSGTLLWLHEYFYQNSYYQYIISEMFACHALPLVVISTRMQGFCHLFLNSCSLEQRFLPGN